MRHDYFVRRSQASERNPATIARPRTQKESRKNLTQERKAKNILFLPLQARSETSHIIKHFLRYCIISTSFLLLSLKLCVSTISPPRWFLNVSSTVTMPSLFLIFLYVISE